MLSHFTRRRHRARRAGSYRSLSCSCALGGVVSVCVLVGSFSLVAQQSRTVDDGVYTAEQAQRGQALYTEQCAACHAESLGGGLGPPLSGDTFVGVWSRLPVSELVSKIHNTMPDNDPGRLTRQEAATLVSYMLQVNGFPAGAAGLGSDEAELSQITWPSVALAESVPVGILPAGSATTAQSLAALAAQAAALAAQAAALAAQSGLAGQASLGAPSAPPLGNLAQVMRGIMFPSSNLLFNVQGRDPGADRTAYDANAPDNFSWVDWGAGIYSGWQIVDYAAIALADAAPLFLTPGRRCENGRPVPVERADWIQYTEELVEAGKAAYRASQTRDQEAVSEVTNVIAEACYNCHEVYRDKRGGTPEDPSNKAARCVP
jgi:cytochrome c2